jgi:hypothetical protein
MCAQVTRAALQPVLECVGPPAGVAVQALRAAGGQAWSALAGALCAVRCAVDGCFLGWCCCVCHECIDTAELRSTLPALHLHLVPGPALQRWG